MTISNDFYAKKFQKLSTIYVLISVATKHPYVECDPDTLEDQVFVFTDEKEAAARQKHYLEEKNHSLNVGKLTGKTITGFLKSLAPIGIDKVVLSDGNEIGIGVEKLIKQPDVEAMKNDKLPFANPEFQISAMYFLQEARKKSEKTKEEMTALRELEEEMLANIARSRFILAGAEINTEKNKTEIKIPLLKTNDGKEFIPFYSTANDFKAFNAKQKDVRFRLLPVEFKDIYKHIPEKADGIIIDPAAFGLVLTRAQIDRIHKMFI